MTNGLGLERSWFRTGENYIIVKWTNMINPVQIHNNRILKSYLPEPVFMSDRNQQNN